VALLVSAKPDLAGKVDIMQMILKQSAEPKVASQCPPYVDHPNDVWGWGILNALDAVLMAQAMGLGAIEGFVYDSTTMDPLSEAEITFSDIGTGWDLFGVSDQNGDYTKVLPAATYNIIGTHYGYLPAVYPGVVVNDGVTTIQDIAMDIAPIWEVSGLITETQTGDPLEGTIIFEETPISSTSSLSTGFYSADVAQGTWWMLAASPGHAKEERLVTVDQDMGQDFSLEAIDNYYMKVNGGSCAPAFSWMDATGGTPRCLSDDSYQYVTLPAGRSFDFYGDNYTSFYVGSNGHITFGSGWNKWSGPIPDPALPNNGIYAFSTDLNPASCGQGTIYTDYVDDRYFVIEFFQVEHYPDGNPETFEIILDLDTGVITTQFWTISDASEAVVGVENSDGTEATQYAYADPVLITDTVAVTYYPAFSTPPPTGEAGLLEGVVSDGPTGDPISGATVYATAFTGGDTYTYTTDTSGYYSDNLCTDFYNMTAEAPGYIPSLEVQATVYSGTQTIQDFDLESAPVIDVLPDTLSASLVPGESWDTNLTIGNDGLGLLTYTLTTTPIVDWLSTTPVSGTVEPLDSESVTVTFNASGMDVGVYTTMLEVYNNDPTQQLVGVPVTLTVGCDSVQNADFEWTPTIPITGEVITFTGTASGTQPILFNWNFGDGGSDFGPVVLHSYANPDDYPVVMTANNCSGESQVVTHTVSVGAACDPLQDVDFSWTPLSPFVGDVITFTASAQGSEPITYNWTFGDGSIGSGMETTHTYGESGTYKITLTVTNCAGLPVDVEYDIVIERSTWEIFLPFTTR
jgi:PKD repeat protein